MRHPGLRFPPGVPDQRQHPPRANGYRCQRPFQTLLGLRNREAMHTQWTSTNINRQSEPLGFVQTHFKLAFFCVETRCGYLRDPNLCWDIPSKTPQKQLQDTKKCQAQRSTSFWQNWHDNQIRTQKRKLHRVKNGTRPRRPSSHRSHPRLPGCFRSSFSFSRALNILNQYECTLWNLWIWDKHI